MAETKVTPTEIYNPYKFGAYLAGSATAGSFTKIGFDAEEFDTNNNFDSTSTKGTYTAPVAGFYFFTGTCQLPSAGVNAISLFKNGVELKRGNETDTTMAGVYNVNALVQLAAADTIDFRAFGSGGTVLTGASHTFCSGFLTSQT